MSAPGDIRDGDRLADLLADEATVGLDPALRDELERLLAANPGVDADTFDRTAALIAVADDDPASAPPMPEGLAERLVRDGSRIVSRRASNAPSAPASTPRASGTAGSIFTELWFPWTLAAAAILLVVLLSVTSQTPTPDTGYDSPQELLAAAPDTQVIPWPENAAGVTGDIVWSNSAQTGFLRLRGLEPNDPDALQYQLWIVDAERNPEFNAVDGGVFNIATEDGTAVIPIEAKLPIFDPAAFAITTEPPGGVVKHDPDLDPDRYRMLAVAPVDS